MWTRNEWMRTGLTAVAAFSLSITGFWALGAQPQAQQLATLQIAQPKLKISDCVVLARLAGSGPAVEIKDARITLKPGAIPPMELLLTNTGSTPQTLHCTARLTIPTMADMLSRVPRAAKPAWMQEYVWNLKPGESLVVALPTGAVLNANGMATLALQSDKQQITALTLVAPAAPAVPAKPVTLAAMQQTK